MGPLLVAAVSVLYYCVMKYTLPQLLPWLHVPPYNKEYLSFGALVVFYSFTCVILLLTVTIHHRGHLRKQTGNRHIDSRVTRYRHFTYQSTNGEFA